MDRGDHVATLNGLKAWFTVRGTGPVCIFPTPGWGASSDLDMRVNRRSGEPWFPSAYAALHSDVDIGTDEAFRDYLEAILPFYFHDISRLEARAFANETYSIEAYTMMIVNQAELARGVLDRLEEVRVPTVIVVGDDDFICSPVQAARIHLRVKGSKLVVIEQAGHFPWLEQPEAFYAGLESALTHLGAFTAQLSV